MSNIFIVGNVIQDTYLKLDERHLTPEIDAQNTPWLDLPFNGASLHYLKQTPIFSGSATTAEPLLHFGHHVFTIDADLSLRQNELQVRPKSAPLPTRYILSLADHVAYLSPIDRPLSKWSVPTAPVDLLLIDISANLDYPTTKHLISYLSFTGCQLALFLHKHSSPAIKGLRSLADFVFTNQPNPSLQNLKSTAQLFHISDHSLTAYLPTAKTTSTSNTTFTPNPVPPTPSDTPNTPPLTISYHLQNPALRTDLTIASIATGTILAALKNGDSPQTALTLAALNLEHSTLDSTLTLTALKKLQLAHLEASDLKLTAKSLLQHPKGILAADESGGSIHKKFAQYHIPDTAKHRRDYRNLFFTTKHLEHYVNGVILFEETAYQTADNGQTFTEFLTQKGIIPGIKVDQGLAPLSEFDPTSLSDPTLFQNSAPLQGLATPLSSPNTSPNSSLATPQTQPPTPLNPLETYTKGLKNLPARLQAYYQSGLRFAKWRAAFHITDTTPSEYAIQTNCRILAAYAKFCQDAHIVPIVEPEVVHDGNYTLDQCQTTTSRILDQLFVELQAAEVELAGCILKCNMVLAGKQAQASSPEDIGAATAATLKQHVPSNLAGVVFLSGGQTPEQATTNLQAVINHGPFPWPVTFSFARALQDPAIETWQGVAKNSDIARTAFQNRLIANTNALTPQK